MNGSFWYLTSSPNTAPQCVTSHIQQGYILNQALKKCTVYWATACPSTDYEQENPSDDPVGFSFLNQEQKTVIEVDGESVCLLEFPSKGSQNFHQKDKAKKNLRAFCVVYTPLCLPSNLPIQRLDLCSFLNKKLLF